MASRNVSNGANGAAREHSLLGPERRRRLVEVLRERGTNDVASLAALFDVTQETIRRDLTALEQEGVLHRVHGGALLTEFGHVVPALPIRKSLMADAKDSIARAALRHMPTDGAVIIDAGTTTGRLAEIFNGGPPLTVLTNALPIATTLAGKRGLVVHTIGGRIRASTLAEVDAMALRALAEVSVDVAFMGTSGVSESHGFSTSDASEAAVKRAMIKAAKRVIVLTDHSKIGLDHFARFADFGDVNLLITDAAADSAAIRALESRGLAVEVAGPVPERKRGRKAVQARDRALPVRPRRT
jgi:DeoR family fructose operon transcriptional repressor